jgi:integrase
MNDRYDMLLDLGLRKITRDTGYDAKLREIEPGESIRDVARLVELPPWEAADVVPSSAAEALAFLAAVKSDPLYPVFVFLLYGMRRGEVLGLRWSDLDGDAIHVRQQVQRIKGEVLTGRSRHALASETCRCRAAQSLV